MSAWLSALAVTAALAAGAGIGFLIGTVSRQTRIGRVTQGLEEITRGNFAHRIIMAGNDEAALAATRANALADVVQRDLEAASLREKARIRLLTNISHDLRTPITSIAGYVDALRRGLGDEPERYLSVIASKTDELARLTDDLFYEARLESGDLELKSRSLDLAEAVRRSLLGFEPQLTAGGARVEISIPDDACRIEGDPSAIDRILANIVSNALRHGQGMTVFSVALTAEDGHCMVSVSNDGPPLPDAAERLFERGVAGPAGGAGLGLSIARELAGRMGAGVSASERAGGGVTFTLTFPSVARVDE